MTLSRILDNQAKHFATDNSIGLCLANFAKQCSDALFLGRNLELKIAKPVDAVFLCGVGGSALAGEMILNQAGDSGKLPFTVIRNYVLPPWATEQSLVLAFSYSGDTEETLACYNQAKDIKATIVAVTSGGKLGEKAREDGVFTIDIPPGFQPRMATLHMALPVLLLLQSMSLLTLEDQAIGETYTTLCQLTKRWGLENPTLKNRAKATALQLYQKTPLIWGSQGGTDVGARNFKNQLNETAEMTAFWGSVPEVNHNEIMSLAQGGNIGLVLLRHNNEAPRVAKRFEVAKTMLAEKTALLTEVKLPGQYHLTALCSAMYFGDLTAYYLSLLNGVDPESIALINSFKVRMTQ